MSTWSFITGFETLVGMPSEQVRETECPAQLHAATRLSPCRPSVMTAVSATAGSSGAKYETGKKETNGNTRSRNLTLIIIRNSKAKNKLNNNTGNPKKVAITRQGIEPRQIYTARQ